jgi:hypothetical protein
MSLDEERDRQMTRIFLTIALVAGVAMGCDTTDTTGPNNYTSNDLAIVGTDTCELFIANDPLEAVITVVGSTVTMVINPVAFPDQTAEVTSDNYDPMQNEVRLTGLKVNADNDPCVVELDDVFTLTLDDPDLSLEEQTTISVTWDHAERDISSAWMEACSLDENGDPLVDENDDPIILWLVELPCAGEAELTLVKASDDTI